MSDITPVHPQILQPVDLADLAPAGSPQTQVAVPEDASTELQQEAATQVIGVYNDAAAAHIAPLPPAGVYVGKYWHPAASLLT